MAFGFVARVWRKANDRPFWEFFQADSASDGFGFKRVLWRFYRSGAGVGHSWRGLVTPAGWFVLGGLVLAAGVGLDTNRTTAYQIFSFLFALCGLGLGVAACFRGRFVVERHLPRFGSVGQGLRYRVSVGCAGGLRGRRVDGLSFREVLPDPRPGCEEFARTPEPGESGRNGFDRFFVYYRWMWLVERARVGVARESGVFSLERVGAGGGWRGEVEVVVVPRRRGVLELGRGEVYRTEALGLFRSRVRVAGDGVDRVTVLPRRYALPGLRLPGAARWQPGGEESERGMGQGEEFVSLRDYRAGDPPRHIHWRSWARTGRPVVKEFQDEFLPRHALVLDTFGRRGGEDVFEEAVSVAASFSCRLEDSDTLLDLLFAGPRAYSFTAGRGLAQVDHILEVLAGVRAVYGDEGVEGGGGTFEGDLRPLVLGHAGDVSSVVCVFLEWDEARRGLVAALEGAGTPVLSLVVLPAGAEAPAGGGGNVRFLRVGRVGEDLAVIGGV